MKAENITFFEKWTHHHLELFKKLSEENFEDYAEINKCFMAKRSRMASAFMQSLKLKNTSEQELDFFKDIIKNHDELFKKLLGEILKYYTDELVKVQRYRKVTAAYDYALGG